MLQVVPFVVVLINQSIAFPLKSIIMKLITWEISRGKGTTKEDSQVSSKVPTISKVNEDHTLAINSIRTRVNFPIGHLNKGLLFFRGLPSWRRPWLNSFK